MNYQTLLRAQLFKCSRALVTGALTLFCVTAIAAQSGRRGTSKSTTTAPTVSGPKQIEVNPQKTAKLQLLVGVEDPNSFINNIPYYLSDTVLDACIGRLSEAADVVATRATRHTSRGDAVKAAKEEKERYVVLLQVGSDAADAGRQTSNSPDQLYVSYEIFEPVTAKIKQRGRSYHGIYKVGNVGVSGPPTSRRGAVYSEYAVKQSAREAEELILAAFDIKVKADRWP